MRTPGGEVPLGQVASAGFARSAATIHRIDGRRAVTVTADVDPVFATGPQVNQSLEDGILERLSTEDDFFDYTFGGQRKQQEQVNTDLVRSLLPGAPHHVRADGDHLRFLLATPAHPWRRFPWGSSAWWPGTCSSA